MDRADDAVPIVELLDERRHLLDVAQWMLGSSTEAESVIDETYRRWYGLPRPARAQIAAPRSWLAQVVGGICLARLSLPGVGRSEARNDGETWAGAERPDGMLQEAVGEVLRGALVSLSPAERAALILNDVFGPARRRAEDAGEQSERADPADHVLRSLGARRLQRTAPNHHDSVARAFRQAWLTQDAALLTSLLAPDAAALFDGGGKVRALVTPVHGNQQVARSLLSLLPGSPRTSLDTRSVNGRTGLVATCDRRVAAVISLDTADHRITHVWATLNPDKLRRWNRARTPPGPPNDW
ncbi:RNA polymerase sigma factor [Streptomyces sp. 142MFCol3.1]|uniref:RNA polymerase sigma factor n=1 Tax=Streptomyces sp. 142MFCol3.1 TaxID=1172179 RepID=UPI000416D48F|nr:RNA polymerase sigma factor [Streptomyces sp. 142MFCol3.1]